jgi:pimeloyl-ACP methyl ester carboxylesterase
MSLPARVSGAAVNVFYLHGFASSPGSTKVGYFTERFREHGIAVRCPDFNEPDFTTLTLTRMLDQLGADLMKPSGPATLIGSSLGGTVAVLAAAKYPTRVDRLVLMAPAVMFAKPGHHLLPPERVDEWRRRGALPFFHFAYNEQRNLNFSFYEDSLRHDAFGAAFTQPALIFQGLRDTSVDYRTVEAFAKTRSNVTLSLLDDDHQLIASLPRMWTDLRAFLDLDA